MLECLYVVKLDESFKRYKFIDNTFDPRDLTRQPTRRRAAGIANFNNRFIFLIGGEVDGKASMTSSYYQILKDEWHEAPSLNSKRSCNNSCSLGRFVYTFGGYSGYSISSIERLDAKGLLEGMPVSWTLI